MSYLKFTVALIITGNSGCSFFRLCYLVRLEQVMQAAHKATLCSTTMDIFCIASLSCAAVSQAIVEDNIWTDQTVATPGISIKWTAFNTCTYTKRSWWKACSHVWVKGTWLMIITEVREGEEKQSERDRKTFLLACTVDHSHPRV